MGRSAFLFDRLGFLSAVLPKIQNQFRTNSEQCPQKTGDRLFDLRFQVV